jgi:hypothetical protein
MFGRSGDVPVESARSGVSADNEFESKICWGNENAMNNTTARYRIILSFVIVAEAVVFTAVVPQLVALGQTTVQLVQTALGA